MQSQSRIIIACSMYGLLVFLGTTVLGFVVAPYVGIASGYFTIATESQAVFSLLTLKAVPYLVGLSVLSGALYPAFSALRPWARVALLVVNALAAWLIGAAVSLMILG